MRCGVFWVLIAIELSIFTSDARQLPFTAKEVALMLRAGYSSEAVAQDLAKRHFAGTVDASTETDLLKAGATPALVNAIKSGRFLVSPEEATRAKAELEAEALRRKALAEESQKFNTLHQDQV